MVCQDRWTLVTGSVVLKGGTFCQEYVVLQDRWSLIVLVFQNRFHYNATKVLAAHISGHIWKDYNCMVTKSRSIIY